MSVHSTCFMLTLKELQALNNSLSPAEIREKIQSIDKEIEETSSKLESLRNGTVKQISKEAMQKTDKNYDFAKKGFSNRKKMFYDLWHLITDSLENPKQLWEKLGFETEGPIDLN